MIARRSLLLVSPALLVVSCTGTQGAVTLEQAKAYFDAASGAALAGAQDYLNSTPAPSMANAALVTQLASDLATIKAKVDGLTTVPDWKAAAQEGLAVIQQLSPLIMPLLGSAAPFLPVAIAVVQSFIAGLPTTQPATPPAALSRKALEYHR